MSQNKLRVVQVGCGRMGQAWTSWTLKTPALELVGLVDVNVEAARERARAFDLPPSMAFGSLREALAATKPDAVFDVTVPAAHHGVTLEALAAGCHVLGEKPMADSMAEAREMVAAAQKAQRVYAVTQTRRPDPNILSIADFVRGGGLGQIEELHCDFYIGAHFGGFRDEMDYPLILDMAIHTFDAARQISGADPLNVYCHSFNPGHSWYKGDASAVAIFQMTDDIVYSYRGSWCDEGLQTTWEGTWRIVGSKGSLLWDGDTIHAEVIDESADPAFHRPVKSVEIPRRSREGYKDGHGALITDFADAVLTGRPPMCPCEDNIKSLAMVLAAVQSAKTGARVDVE